MTSEKGSRKDKNQNIQVFVRLRPLNQRERDIKSLGVIEVVHNQEVVVRLSQQNSHTKKFTFDRAFGPNAKQVEIYQNVVSPLIEEVLAGYNCTVFAYGQTGTGKTHTMVGESTGDEHTWQNDPLAGIIPRALSQLFDELRLSNTEYTVRVSYLELYNEELFDLLSASDDNSKLRIYEDVTRKGSNIVNGLEEITVSNKNEVYKIMAQGQERKRVASTLMNAQSSRSHTVFTIVVHMRENSPEGEELVKIGKLNLVDLAGSENISKAGSDNPGKKERARECVNINQSLLTLGRVITALVERHPHIPYRESKLTRILQESLGGRTKTSIIATISPGHKDLEETMSTLEYANRAKNIQNKPEVNQKMTKKAILKEYAEEIDRLKRELQASRDNNGVYLATDTYAEITLKQEEQRREIQELLLLKRAVEEQKDKAEALFSEMNRTLEKRDSELKETKNKLSYTKTKLINTANLLESTKLECEEQKHLVSRVSETERTLSAQAQEILRAADTAASHVHCLHDTVDKRRNVESKNLQVTKSYREQASQHRSNIAANMKHFTMTLVEGLTGLHSALDDFATNNSATLQGDKVKLEDILQQIQETMDEMKKLTDESHNKLVVATESQRAQVESSVSADRAAVESCLRRLLRRAAAALHAARARDVAGNLASFVQHWYVGAAERVSSLCVAQQSFVCRAQDAAARQQDAVAHHTDAITARKDQNDALVQALHEKVERDSIELEKRLSEQLEEIESERRDSQSRLQAWVEEERRAFEERLQKHVESETAAMERRLSRKVESINQERVEVQSRVSSQRELLRRLLEQHARDSQLMMQELQHWEDARTGTLQTVATYDKEFHEGARAIGSDMEAFSGNVVQVVGHLYRDLLAALQQDNQLTEEEAQSVVTQVHSTGAQFVQETNAALDDVVSTNKRVVDDMITSLQAKSSASLGTLSSVAASLGAAASATSSQAAAHGASTRHLTSELARFEDSFQRALADLDEVEGRCLSDEYKVYSPTGKTPSRSEYRYPRALAATSPHERVLARYRAARQHSLHDLEVLVDFGPKLDENELNSVLKDLRSRDGVKDAVFKDGAIVVETTLPNQTVLDIVAKSSGKRTVLQGFGETQSAVAMVSSQEGTGALGIIRFQQGAGALIADGSIDNLPPGKHGLHVREDGDLSQGCSSVGGHYNPANSPHGSPTDPPGSRHAGDLGNIHADDTGRATFRIVDHVLQISDIIGRCIAVTERPDDLGKGSSPNSKVDGDSGKPIACGIIARSAGVFQNPKRICQCDGVVVWDERDKPIAGKGRRENCCKRENAGGDAKPCCRAK